jgi:hypothetical protein
MENYIETSTLIIKSLLLGWLISTYQPLKDGRNIISEFLSGWTKLVFDYVFSFISCWKCSGFLFALFLTQDIYLATAVAILAFKLDPIINRIKL